MANRADKERFFAQLDRLDESTETESESEADRRLIQQQTRKRQKLDTDAHVNVGAVKRNAGAATTRSLPTIDANLPRQSRLAPVRVSEQKTDSSDSPAPKQQPNLNQRTAGILSTKQKSISRESKVANGLFKDLTFYFIPNDDVSNPRKLRIQSAMSQGAIWARKLGSDVTHIIVDPEITASAVAKYVKDKSSISGVPCVKMNWLIESLSHKSVRRTSDSRFQLKGASIVSTSAKQPLQVIISKAMPLAEQCVDKNVEDPDASEMNPEDDLFQMVKDLKAAPDLPFDEEMDLEAFLSISSGDEQAEQRSKKHQKTFTAGRELHNEQSDGGENNTVVDPRSIGFTCMQSNPGKQTPTPNDRTIVILQKMATYYDRTGDNWRTLAYRRAITALRKHDTHVKTAKQACKINGIGTPIADKIEEIVTTDRLKRLDAVLSDPDDTVLQLFMGIYGVGICQAKAWMEQGYRTLDDLTQSGKLTPNQKIGIVHHADFAQRIPRSEVKQHGDIVAQALKVADRNLQGIIGGSYRRGNADSGDIDVIVTHPTATLQQLQTWIFDIIVPHLFQIRFMKCALATSRPSQSTPQRSTPAHLISPSGPSQPGTTSSGSKFHGASQLPPSPANPSPSWRRIDLLLVPPTSIGAALIYFTGNDIFNRSLRLLASKKGMRLNQHGLYKDVIRGKGRVKITEGELVEGRSEKKIFEVLGVPWRSATERNC